MSDKKKEGWSRRHFLKGLGTAGLAAAAGAGLSMWERPKSAISGPKGEAKEPKFLIVLAASGGASIIDSLMAIRESESKQSDTINCFPDSVVQNIDGTPFRAVDMKMSGIGPIPAPFQSNQSAFIKKYKDDIMVVTQTGSSVTHQIGQRRSITGNEAWFGRTLQECVAQEYGENFILPNVLLATGTSFIEHGSDKGIKPFALGETVANPAVWPLGLNGTKGISKLDRDLVQQMRMLRNEKLDPKSRFAQAFGQSDMLKRWQYARGTPQRQIENQDLITKLMLYPDSAKYPLAQSGLKSSPAAERVRRAFPNFEIDALEAQAALAFLLLKFRVSVSVTIGPRFDLIAHGDENVLEKLRRGGGGGLPEGTIINPPIAFDFSHQGHRSTQAMMWDRIFKIADGLITLLRSEEYKDGESFWDRSMVYIATDFGRSKIRPSKANDFGTSHDLNNGYVVISPLVNGGKLLGGVNPDTGMTYGFDPNTGKPDRFRTTEEKEMFAGLLHALDVNTEGSGLPDMRVMRKKA